MSGSDEMVVRTAGPDDDAQLAGLRLAWAAEKGVDTTDADFGTRFSAWLAAERDRRVFWLAEAGGPPVGMVNLMLFERMPYPESAGFRRSWGYLGNLYVLPERRGQGIGTALIEACTTYAATHSLARIVLSPSPASIPLYRRAGFAEADELMLRSFE